MQWSDLNIYPKFTPMKDIFKKFGDPKFKLVDLPIYYLGKGYLLAYSEKKFRIENNQRIEHGESGEYFIRLYYFHNQNDLKTHFNITSGYEFESDTNREVFEITEGIKIGSPYDEVVKKLKNKADTKYYNEGESRTMNQNKLFVHQHDWIIWGKFKFYFFAKSQKKILSAFEYNV